MSGETPEVGDKASWNWNGSAPSGHVVEKKDEGEVSVQSKRGNTIKKAAQPDDPAVHLSRPGNDVVKNQSELNVEEKKADGGAGEKEKGHNEGATNGEPESAKTGEKRKAEDEAEDDGEPEAKKPKARGRPKGSASTTPAKKAEQKEPAKKRGRPSAADKPAAPAAEKKSEKKSVGRPKKEGGATPKAKKDTKAKKGEKSKAPATGIGKRTRSGGK